MLLRHSAIGVIATLGLAVLVAPVAQAQPEEQEVTYAGVSVAVPSDWEVVDLDASDDVCLRLDRPTVYLGTPPEQQNCPARAVGRTETLWIGPTTPEETQGGDPAGRSDSGTQSRGWSKGAGKGTVHRNAREHQQTLVLEGRGLSVRSTWGSKESAVSEALEGVTVSRDPKPVPQRRATGRGRGPASGTPRPQLSGGTGEAGPTVSPTTSSPSAASASQALYRSDAGPQVLLAQNSSIPVGRPLYGGMAFDTCAAPSASTMQAWRQSPYVAVGIYTSGSMRACPFNRGASWVSEVTAQGWGLIPIHVGLQAPCVTQSGLASMSRDLATARSQGVSEAGVAISGVQAAGMGAGTAIYLDLEYYATNDPGCSAATLAFVSAWTQELQRRGYVSAVYGAAGSLMRDMSRAVLAGDSSFTPPQQIWVAHWNQLQTVWDTYSPQFYPDSLWVNHQRLRQYAGDHQETWGGVTVNIDSNWVDANLPGNPVQTDYGTNAVGPGSAGFVFTGSMSYWRAAPGSGRMQKAYWTRPSSSSTEYNGATWSTSLASGTYRVDVNVPSTSNAAIGRYSLTAGGSTSVRTLDQAAGSGWRSLGNITNPTPGKVSVHLSDNGTTDTTRTLWADAIRFVATDAGANAPSAPTGVTATAGDGQATITWSPANPNGSAITSYTVTAAPGGAATTVAGGTTSATLTGLANGTAYTFTVTATNAGGAGPASTPTAPVTPGRAGGMASIDPVRVLDTRVGAPANPGVTSSVPAGGTVRVRVAGSGTPVPSTASAVVANLTVIGGSGPGWIGVTGTPSSLINWTARATVANLSTLPVAQDGTVTLTNGATTPAHLIIDVQGWTGPQESAKLTSISAARLMDTRVGTPANSRVTALGPNETIEVKVTGAAVPSGAQAALLRVTATAPNALGHLTVSPTGAGTTSVVNFSPGDSVGNAMVANLTASGTVRLTNHSTGTTHVVVDAQGWIGGAAAQLYRATPQVRLIDTRTGTTTNPGVAILGPNEVRTFRVAGAPGSSVPSGTSMVAVNLTVTNATKPGWVAVGASSSPGIPLVNYVADEARAGFGTVDVAPDGTVRVRNESTGSVHVVLDVHGYGSTSP